MIEKNKKVAISTMVGDFNLGNRLQNYALQQFIKLNFPEIDVYTLRFNPYEHKKSKFSKLYKKLGKIKSKVKKGYFKQTKRLNNFKYFDKNINFDDTEYTLDNENEIDKKYNYVVAGSDQVWNENMSPNMTTHLLPFVDGYKRVSYAASLGKVELSNYEKGAFRKYLKDFNAISVREKVSVDILKQVTDNKVVSVLDPTLMLSQEDWQKVERKPKFAPKGKYALLFFLGTKSEKAKNFIQELKDKGYKIIDIIDLKSKWVVSGPAEFLYLVRNASIVATDSFHCIAFSIINNRPVVHVERIGAKSNMTSRISNLEEVFNCKIPNLKNSTLEDILNFKIENKDEILNKQKEFSFKFLQQAFSKQKPVVEKNNNLTDEKFNCSSCGLCKNICPVGAISYKENEEGFLRPVIDKNKCIKCGLCLKKCTALNKFNKLNFDNGIYALKQKEYKEGNYSSTGLFGCIAKQIIAEGGVVFGAKYDKNKPHFQKVEKVEDLKQIEGSKYFHIDISSIYDEVESCLKQNKKVLVGALPCQISGLRTKFKNNKNLILVQVLCHGVSPQKMFRKITTELFGDVPEFANFRASNKNEKSPLIYEKGFAEYKYKDKTHSIALTKDIYNLMFLRNLCLNDSCYTCNYAGRETGADIIIGDCWNINDINKKFYTYDGISILYAITENGLKYFEKVKDDFVVYKVPKSKENRCNPNLYGALKYKLEYNKKLAFVEGVKNNENIVELVKTLSAKPPVDNSFKGKIKRLIKRILKV